MWELKRTPLDGGIHCRLSADGQRLSYARALALLRDEEGFREFFVGTLIDHEYDAVHWETPPVSTRRINREFEFVLLDGPYLDVTANITAFSRYLEQGADPVAVFDNLGGDAVLVAPAMQDMNANYAHLAAFTRTAPREQQHALWQTVAETTLVQLGDRPLWLNTAGGGVPWLHVRVDRRPKYYRHLPFRDAP